MTSYCSTAELIAVTTSNLSSTTLQAIIDDGDREIDAYLKQYGLTGSGDNTIKTASLKLAQAGVYSWSILHAPLANVSDSVIRLYRAAAFELLDHYIATQQASTVSKRCFIRAVQGK